MNRTILILAALEASALILLAINFPAQLLTAFLFVACGAALLGGLWLQQAGADSAEYDEEHDLP